MSAIARRPRWRISTHVANPRARRESEDVLKNLDRYIRSGGPAKGGSQTAASS